MHHVIHQAFPYLRVRDAAAAIEFYRQAFGATEQFRLVEPGGRIGHAQLSFGDATIMLSDEFPEYGIHGPQALGGTGASIHLHVEDVDAMARQAAEVGAQMVMSPTDQFYGERTAKLVDPFGHEWLLGAVLETLTPEEMQRRYSEMVSG